MLGPYTIYIPFPKGCIPGTSCYLNIGGRSVLGRNAARPAEEESRRGPWHALTPQKTPGSTLQGTVDFIAIQ